MTAAPLPDGTYLEFRGRRYRGSIRPGGQTVELVSSSPEEGFVPRNPGGGWRREVPRADVVRVTLTTACTWRDQPFQVLARQGDQWVLRHRGGSRTARELGLTEVDRGVFNATVPTSEVSEVHQERRET